MPPRYAYWTILIDDQPTAFRAASRDDLLPTLRQIQARHPGAVMKWFARGQLWESPEQAREARVQRQPPPRDRRPPAWRPGGEHRDPRDRFKQPRDVRRKNFADRLRRDRMHPRPPTGRRPPRPPDRRRPPHKKKKDDE